MTTPAKTTAYTKCEQCGFWHAPDEPHCANCGISFVKNYKMKIDYNALEKYRAISVGIGGGVGAIIGAGYLGLAHPLSIVSFFLFGSISAFLLGGLLFNSLFSNSENMFFKVSCFLLMGYFCFMFAFFGPILSKDIFGINDSSVHGEEFFSGGIAYNISILLAFIIGDTNGRKKCTRPILQYPEVIAQGLCQNEEVIKQRLDEIGQKEQKIRGMVQELNQQGDPQRNRVRFQTLDKGAAELSRQRDRYDEKLREIELIRWSNQLSPLLSHSPQLNEQQATERLNTLSEIQTKGQKLAQTWQQTPLADEETRCADRLNQALTTCDQLRQDLLDLKTALAVGDISAFNKEEQRASQTALELLDTFNALPDVGGFTAGFKKLEDEYFRLQSEDEVRQLTK